jgi:Winged helix-turn helix
VAFHEEMQYLLSDNVEIAAKVILVHRILRRDYHAIRLPDLDTGQGVLAFELVDHLDVAEGRSTRSIAEEVGVQPRIVSNWRRRFADHGLGGLKDDRSSRNPPRQSPSCRTSWWPSGRRSGSPET